MAMILRDAGQQTGYSGARDPSEFDEIQHRRMLVEVASALPVSSTL
jgi:hypothetical protein